MLTLFCLVGGEGDGYEEEEDHDVAGVTCPTLWRIPSLSTHLSASALRGVASTGHIFLVQALPASLQMQVLQLSGPI